LLTVFEPRPSCSATAVFGARRTGKDDSRPQNDSYLEPVADVLRTIASERQMPILGTSSETRWGCRPRVLGRALR